MFGAMLADLKAIRQRDPACRSYLEAFLCYPGFHALCWYRLSHRLYRWNMPLYARIVNTFARFLTGADIHPGATIGRGVFIDHAMGVVIGETAIVGDNVTMLHEVTLGGTGKEHGKRHPTIEAGVLIGAGAKILGNITIGEGAKVGSGTVVNRSVDPHSTVVGVLGRVVRVPAGVVLAPSETMDQINLPDILTDRMTELHNQVQALKVELDRLHTQAKETARASGLHLIAAAAAPGSAPEPGAAPANILDEVMLRKRAEVAERKVKLPVSKLPARIEAPGGATVRDFPAALVHFKGTEPSGDSQAAANGTLKVIAEFKRKSPSGGDLRPGAEVADVARAYQAAGAAALSVLTDGPGFGGSLDDLRAARAACTLPVLRKDFTCDEYQIDEAWSHGADAILLIVAALTELELKRLYDYATQKGLHVLVEVHDAAEMAVARKLGANLIGVNNRNLKTLKTDLQTSLDVLATVPDAERRRMVLVTESGLRTHADLERLHAAGYQAALVGESLLRQPDLTTALRDLIGAATVKA